MNNLSMRPVGFQHTSRREWLQLAMSLLAGSTSQLRPTFAGSPNDQIEIGLIGVGVRGKYLLSNLPADIRVTALCDCAMRRIESAQRPQGNFKELLRNFAENVAPHCRVFQDYREMMSSMKLDAVIIAAPDHHHAPAAILAMKQGCDVYVEKPLATTIAEGRAIVDAAKKYQRIVQVGSQQRSMKINQIACEFIRAGGLGKIHRIDERNLPGSMPYESDLYPAQSIPSDLDWNLFCGATPLRPYHPNLWIKEEFNVGKLLWRGWDLFDDYSGHLATNWGGHSFDMVQYALGLDDSGPLEIASVPGVSPEATAEWANKTPALGTCHNPERDQSRFWQVNLRYANGTLLHLKNGEKQMVFYGEKGKMVVTRNYYACDPVDLLPPMDKDEVAKWDGDGHVARPHLENWIAAMRQRAQLNANIETGHRTATVCHLVNIARQFREPLRWDPVQERFVGNSMANEFLARERRPGFDLT